jgi:hypothetical protein
MQKYSEKFNSTKIKPQNLSYNFKKNKNLEKLLGESWIKLILCFFGGGGFLEAFEGFFVNF